ncbi:uncharacterized protein V1513DRAFT_438224 [Lipomyces chichibuensis]|uniref:uncharacterized protein n=1 Tax=Lipomyces chichibuensis TaxID=1546026 RepID=UPI0033439FDF
MDAVLQLSLNLPNKLIEYDVETRWNSFRMLNDGLLKLLNDGLLNDGLLNDGLLNDGLLNDGLLNDGQVLMAYMA